MTAIGAASKVMLHPLAIRPSDDDPTSWVVGRLAGGEFVELPAVGVDAIRLLDSGLSVAEVEQRLASDDERPDVAGLLDALADLSWVAAVDGQRLPDPIGPARVQFAWLRPHRLRWLFTVPTALGAAAAVLFATVTVIMNPDLLPSYRDFFWTDYPGLASLVNTTMFVAVATVHELLHLAAARALGLPARIGLGTRLSNLALQTDVSSAWAVPRRQRYRIYLVGMVWDGVVIAAALLVSAYADPAAVVRDLLAAFVLVIGLSLVLQSQVYMRTDVFFVLMDLLRCGNLFHDGLAYARYLAVRTIRRPAPPDPSLDLPARQRRAVRIYAPLVGLGSAVALSVFAFYFLPLLVDTSVRAIAAMVALGSGGSLLRAADGVVVLTVQWGLQVLFLVTFHKSHPTWFRWGSRRQRGR
jgi:putative peptide zinc metalloprotease protein